MIQAMRDMLQRETPGVANVDLNHLFRHGRSRQGAQA